MFRSITASAWTTSGCRRWTLICSPTRMSRPPRCSRNCARRGQRANSKRLPPGIRAAHPQWRRHHPPTSSVCASWPRAINTIAAEQETCLIRLNLGWPADMTRYNHPLDYLGGDGGGGIGAGPGLTVGAALALRGTGRLPLAVLGDGDFIMGISALWTATHSRIPLADRRRQQPLVFQ